MRLPSSSILASCLAERARGTLGGLFHSSALAELAGVITGLMSPEPVHIGLDNMAVNLKAAAYLDAWAPPRRPLAIQPDGDLWQLMTSLTQQRGTTLFAPTGSRAM